MSRANDNRWLHRFAVLTAAATLLLICVGGVVTSNGAGLSVPDWPTSYGYNMFFFPFSKWRIGGIFYEHSHRLVASGVGLLTVGLAVWLWVKEQRRWLRWLGVAAVFGVMLQGLLGGLRVTQLKDEIGIFHAALAQLFFVCLSAIALFTSAWWREGFKMLPAGRKLIRLYWLGTCLIFAQLTLGATMRHQHAGLAIPDFPLAYHHLWPATDPESIATYNQQRIEMTVVNPITAFQINLQMAHRILAVLILAVVLWTGIKTWRLSGSKTLPGKLCVAWLLLIVSQVLLGAATIWSGKSADLATAHVAVGALSLLTGTLTILTTYRCLEKVSAFVPVPAEEKKFSGVPIKLPA